MHQAAFPGEDISDRPEPGDGGGARPSGRCSTGGPPSGRYRRDRPAAARRAPAGDGGRAAVEPAAGPVGRRSRRRPAAWPATRCGCWSPARAGSTHAAFRDLAGFLAARRPGRRQHLGHAGRGGRRRAGPAAPGDRAPLDRRCTTAPGRSSCGPGRGPTARCATSRPGETRRAARAAGCTSSSPTRTATRPRSRLWRARVVVPGSVPGVPRAGTAGRSPTPTCRGDWPLRELPDGLRPGAGQRRDAQRRAAVHRRDW